MRRVSRIQLYLRHPPFLRALFCTVYSSRGGIFCLFAQVRGLFSVLFCSILVLIYAALFVLAGVSVLIHECVA